MNELKPNRNRKPEGQRGNGPSLIRKTNIIIIKIFLGKKEKEK